ncbi:exported hypothetical protein [Hyphomicrobiales bacterium]|nr:exported hypothetical protein [Hyphomicrobiales bacterium]CAH1668281.1 exported hypothetical protein [Hyphomicrobiales bacterium]
MSRWIAAALMALALSTPAFSQVSPHCMSTDFAVEVAAQAEQQGAKITVWHGELARKALTYVMERSVPRIDLNVTQAILIVGSDAAAVLWIEGIQACAYSAVPLSAVPALKGAVEGNPT